ncbi:unnamed protein product [Tuber aestivum]|uniref:Uncharacterized protein n=1 Tax=Tuber aestivum TaxID=59557 RepID=A0A292PK36_9PEZI|nr:unnamed protein product [Tuber aestivum]
MKWGRPEERDILACGDNDVDDELTYKMDENWGVRIRRVPIPGNDTYYQICCFSKKFLVVTQHRTGYTHGEVKGKRFVLLLAELIRHLKKVQSIHAFRRLLVPAVVSPSGLVCRMPALAFESDPATRGLA